MRLVSAGRDSDTTAFQTASASKRRAEDGGNRQGAMKGTGSMLIPDFDDTPRSRGTGGYFTPGLVSPHMMLGTALVVLRKGTSKPGAFIFIGFKGRHHQTRWTSSGLSSYGDGRSDMALFFMHPLHIEAKTAHAHFSPTTSQDHLPP